MSNGTFFIIEHATRGVLMTPAWEADDGKHHFSWSKPRTEGKQYKSAITARAVLGDANLPKDCYVVQFTPGKSPYDITNGRGV